MDVLIRELRIATDGTPEITDKEFSGDNVTIGCAPNQVIQLIGFGIAAEHAIINRAASDIKITCCDDEQITINQRSVINATLHRGDTIALGAHRLRLIAAPSGFDIAIEVQLSDKVDSSEFEGAFQTELKKTRLNKRSTAWLSSVIVLILFLGIPLFLVGVRHFVHLPEWLPGDRLWSPGPLSAAHQHAMGNDCSSCHKVLFQRVTDAACTKCHVLATDHVRPEHLALTTLGDKPRCATCHREHVEPVSRLIVADNGMCKGCHAKSSKAFGTLQIKEVDGFSSKAHPEFTLHLLQSTPMKGDHIAANAVEWREVIASPATATEDSHLKFPHAVHLDPAHVTRLNDGKPMSCLNCHQLNDDGQQFKPVTMQSACADCHDLAFDTTNPARQLPHGKPREVIQMLQEYYAAKYLDPTAVRAVQVERRRIPGRDTEQEGCDGPPMVCARQETARQVEIQFNVRGCVTCHQVVDTQSSELASRYQVMPIRLTSNYYPDARFLHRSHFIQGNLSGDDACNSCHQAKKSERSQDVMVPGIDHCLACHSSRADDHAPDSQHSVAAAIGHGTNIVLGCIQCHDYHPAQKPKIAANAN